MMMKSSKKSIIISAVSVTTVAAIIALVALFSGCGSSDTATADEATETTKSIISTSDEVATLATLSDTDQAIVDNGLTVNEKGDIVDKDGKKVEPSEDGKVTIKDANGKEIKIDTDSVKIANTNKAQVETTNAAIQSANSNSSSKSNSSSDGNSSKSNSSNKNTSNSKSNTSSSSSSKGNSTSNSSATSDPHAGKTYHEAEYKTIHHEAETEQVWVVDQEAYTKEEPVYETIQTMICSEITCKMDLLGLSQKEISAHMKQHALKGENAGWHSGTKNIQVDTKIVEASEQGHYETRIIKEAYDEKVLVKEAGWY